MGPYCMFCGDRCFVPVEDNDYIKKDLKATCEKGVIFDLDSTYTKVLNSNGEKIGWMLIRNNGENYSLILEIVNGQLLEYEVSSYRLQEIIDFTKPPKENNWFILK